MCLGSSRLISPCVVPSIAQVRLAKEGKLRLSRRQRKVDDERWRTVNHLEAEKVLKQQGKV